PSPRGGGHPVWRLPSRPGSRPRVGVLLHVHHSGRGRPLRVARSADLVRDGELVSGATVPVVLRVPSAERAGGVAYFARRNPRIIIGGALVLAWLFIAALAPFISPYHPIKVNVTDSLLPPGRAHLPRTAHLPRPLLSPPP